MQRIPRLRSASFVLLATLGGWPSNLAGQFDREAPEPLPPLGGTLLLGGGGPVPAATVELFLRGAGGAANALVCSAGDTEVPPELRDLRRVALARASDDDWRAIANARGLWLTAASAGALQALQNGPRIAKVARALIARGGVLGAHGPAAESLGASTTSEEDSDDTNRPGLDIVPGTVFITGFEAGARARLMAAAAPEPLVGLGIAAGTTMVLQKRFFDVIGDGSVYVAMAAGSRRPERFDRIHRDISPVTQRGGRPTRGPGDPLRFRRLEDLVALRRAAQARAQAPFPADQPPAPWVANGTLILVGGGGSPPGFMDRFMALAGGKDALLLYIPCTESATANVERTLARWRRAGATNVDFIHTKDRNEADTSKEIHAKLRRAGGLFFGGGRQWNLVDSWQHTEAHRLMHQVLARGGVIAGSSAGASIQSSYMPRGNSLGNRDPMAEGYETGLGFLVGCAVDQHFSQRRRFRDMSALVERYPQLLGIGLDEAAAIIVRGATATCWCRKGRFVHFYDRSKPSSRADFVRLSSGQQFDLARRQLIHWR